MMKIMNIVELCQSTDLVLGTFWRKSEPGSEMISRIREMHDDGGSVIFPAVSRGSIRFLLTFRIHDMANIPFPQNNGARGLSGNLPD